MQEKIWAVIQKARDVANTVKQYLWVQSPTELWPLSIDQSIRWKNLVDTFSKGMSKWLPEVKRQSKLVAEALERELAKTNKDFDEIERLLWVQIDLKWFDGKNLTQEQAIKKSLQIQKKAARESQKIEQDQQRRQQANEKFREDLQKKATQNKIESLKAEALEEIKTISESEGAVRDKAEKIEKIEDNLAKSIKRIKWKGIDAEIDLIKEGIEEQEQFLDDLEDKVQETYEEKFVEAMESSRESITDLNEEIGDQVDAISKLEEELDSVNKKARESIAETKQWAQDDLLSRFIDVSDDIKSIQSQEKQDEEDKKKLEALQNELSLIKELTSEQERSEAVRFDGLSETQKIIERRDARLAEIEAERLLEVQRIEQERATSIAKIQILESELADRQFILDSLVRREAEANRKITENYGFEIKKRKDFLEDLQETEDSRVNYAIDNEFFDRLKRDVATENLPNTVSSVWVWWGGVSSVNTSNNNSNNTFNSRDIKIEIKELADLDRGQIIQAVQEFANGDG